jgi:4-amino-4-deoxy-L-arabinose transferase-like glycosyltransferase
MVAAALLGRLILVLCVFRDVAAPTVDHNEFGWEMGWTARSLALGRGFGSPFLPFTGPTALVPPLFPWLLAAVFRIFGLYSAQSAIVILSLNSLFSALTCIPIYLSIRHALGHRAAAIAGWAWVVYPYAIYFSAGRVWDYALTGLLFSLSFYAVQRIHLKSRLSSWFGLGLLFGLTCLSNPSVALNLGFLLLFAAWKVQQVGGPWLRRILVTGIAFFAVLAPWTLRNYRTLHIVSPVRDGFWLEAYAGNNGNTFKSNDAAAHPASNPVEMQLYQQYGEVAYMAQKKALTLDFVQHHPLFTLGITLRRVLSFWTGFWSWSRAYLTAEPFDIPNVFFSTALTLFMLRGLRRLWAINHQSAFSYLILLLVFPIPYYLSHTTPDYRQPIEPMIATLVTFGIFSLRTQEQEDESPDSELTAEDDEREPELVMARS